jgi:hypothetical protein
MVGHFYLECQTIISKVFEKSGRVATEIKIKGAAMIFLTNLFY